MKKEKGKRTPTFNLWTWGAVSYNNSSYSSLKPVLLKSTTCCTTLYMTTKQTKSAFWVKHPLRGKLKPPLKVITGTLRGWSVVVAGRGGGPREAREKRPTRGALSLANNARSGDLAHRLSNFLNSRSPSNPEFIQWLGPASDRNRGAQSQRPITTASLEGFMLLTHVEVNKK